MTSPKTTPPLVVGEVEGSGEPEGAGEGDREALGLSSKLGSIEAEGEGEGARLGRLRMPAERRSMSPIAPIIMAATRPDKVDFMSYIIS